MRSDQDTPSNSQAVQRRKGKGDTLRDTEEGPSGLGGQLGWVSGLPT